MVVDGYFDVPIMTYPVNGGSTKLRHSIFRIHASVSGQNKKTKNKDETCIIQGGHGMIARVLQASSAQP